MKENTPTAAANETLAQVTGSVQLSAFRKLGVLPQAGYLSMFVAADTYYQVMVVKTDDLVPADVKGVPVVGATKGSTQCTGRGDATAVVYVGGNRIAEARCPVGAWPGDFSTVATSTFPTDFPVSIDTEAFGGVMLEVSSIASFDKGYFSADADRSFEIDLSFACRNDFQRRSRTF
jgi:hypothetical protein